MACAPGVVDLGEVDTETLAVTPATCTEETTDADPETGHCYMLFTEEATWPQARQRCSELGDGAHLADVTRDSEHRIIADLRMGVVPEVWLAGSDADAEGTWVWSTSGDPITTDHWETGEPDSRVGDEDCLALMMPENWHDRTCESRFAYICERDALPDDDDDPIDDAPGSLYACAVAPGGSGSGAAWVFVILGLMLAVRRR